MPSGTLTEPIGVGRISIEYVREMGGAPQASVIAGGFKTSMTNAAYVNGTMAHALDFDNTWYPLNHPTSPTLPGTLAIAVLRCQESAPTKEDTVAPHDARRRRGD